MARWNQLTGAWEDDGSGMPFDPAMPPPIEAPVTDLQEGAGGGAPPTATFQVIQPQARPVSTTEDTYKLKSAESALAEGGLATAEEVTNDATRQVGVVEDKEADARAVAAQKKFDLQQAEQQRQMDAEEQTRAQVEDSIAQDDASIEEDKKAKIAAGRAHESFFEGRPVASFFTKLLVGIGNAADIMRGGSGRSPAQQFLDGAIEQHRQKLVGRWEASREANILKRQNRQKWEAERERRGIVANNQALASINMIDEGLNATLAGLSKEKQGAVREQAIRQLDEQRAQQKLQRAEGYNRLHKLEVHSYPNEPAKPSVKPTEGTQKSTGQLQDIINNIGNAGQEVIPDEYLKKIRDQSEDEAAAAKTSGQGVVGTKVVKGLRALKVLPESAFEDVPEQYVNAYNAQVQAFDALNTMVTGAGQSDTEYGRRARSRLPQPGDKPAVRARKINDYLDYVVSHAVQAGPEAEQIIAKANAARAQLKPAVGKEIRGTAGGAAPSVQTRTIRNPTTGETKRQSFVGGKWQDL